MTKKAYDESSIKTLDALTHIRMRTGMYIGRLGDGSHIDDGIYILLKEIIDNSIDEFIMHQGDKIVITANSKDNILSVRDFGRGIPLGKVIDCVSQINTGAKYNDEVFQFSVGLNGVGLKAANALSSHFCIRSFREGKMFEAIFERGILKTKKMVASKEPDGTFVAFIPDIEIFKKYKFREEYIIKRLWNYAYLNTGLSLIFNDEVITSPNGLLDLLNHELSEEKIYHPLHFCTPHLEFAFVHTHAYGENYFSFVNGQYTSDGGTHLTGFREGLVKGINEYAKKSFQGIDVREGIIACILIKVKEPVFESQTKNKLGNTEMRSYISQEVKKAVIHLLHSEPEAAKKWVERIHSNEKLRKELSLVKKQARERQKKVLYKIPSLRDSKYHLNKKSSHSEHTMIFLTEGESATATMMAARDPLRQAIFSLRGKPLNVHGMDLSQLYKNEELYNMMSALNIEEDISNLRYNKIILATDADVDGMHIRNLLITFFLTYFENLVLNGHLFILETPLFKVRNATTVLYCYNEEEKNEAVNALQGSRKKELEITRFKGLGEISPKEFKQFIGESMHLSSVLIDSLADVAPTLTFYMGKNTPERKQFIMDNLIEEEDM